MAQHNGSEASSALPESSEGLDALCHAHALAEGQAAILSLAARLPGADATATEALALEIIEKAGRLRLAAFWLTRPVQ